MEKAKYYIHGVNGKAVIDTLVSADKARSAGGDRTLESIVHPGFADPSDEPPPWPNDTDDGAIRTNMIARFVGYFGEENPFKWFDYDKGGFHPTDADQEANGFVLPLKDHPKEAGLDVGDAVKPVVEVEIEFADHGAPAQVHRTPGIHGVSFQRRHNASRLLGRIKQFRKQTVHVFVVDQGMDPEYVNALGGPGTYQDVLWNTLASPKPTLGKLPTEHLDRYRSRPQWHAHMIVRNVLAMGGDNRGLTGRNHSNPIRVYDVPVIPDRVTDVLDTATAIYLQYLAIITAVVTLPANDRAIIVNAWGVKNRFRETPIGAFTETYSHPLNDAIMRLAVRDFPPNKPPDKWKPNNKSAVVFAAGNNGLFTPNPEAGQLDRGPMRSIWYPAALPFVWSAATADVTGKWIGVSSQGPAGATPPQEVPSHDKPDFALPSYLSEFSDSHALNTGTSASCGLLAGMVAAHWRHKNQPPDRAFASANAKRFGHVDHSGRLGDGVPQDGKLGP